MHTVEVAGLLQIRKQPSEHACQVSAIARAKEQIRREFRAAATTSTVTPLHVIQEFKAGKSIQEMEHIPSDKAMTRVVQR